MVMPLSSHRIEEVDALRGAGIVAMVLFHFFFDLRFLGLSALDPYAGPYLLLQRTAASLMIIVSGISLALSRASAERQGVSFHPKLLRHVSVLGAAALLVTFATWIYPHEGFIVFGVLHFLALSALLAAPLTRQPFLALAFGVLVFATSSVFTGQTPAFGSPFLLWFGFPPSDFYSLDYFPLLPWFGLFLFGVFLGSYYYARGARLLQGAKKFPRPLLWLSRRSLLAYLIHQPVLFAILLSYKFLAGL